MSKGTLGVSDHLAGLSSVLVDLTTDYLAPVAECLGMSCRTMAAVQARFRPEVRFLGSGIFGLTAASLDTVMRDTLAEVHRAGGDVQNVMRLLCSLCAGHGNWAAHALQDWAEAGRIWQGMLPDGLSGRVAASFDLHVVQPGTFIRDYELAREQAWMLGPRSEWDQVAYDRIFGELGVPPSLRTAFERKFVRDFAADMASKLDDAALGSLHEAARSALAADGAYDAANALLPLQSINGCTAADWQAVFRSLNAAGFEPGR